MTSLRLEGERLNQRAIEAEIASRHRARIAQRSAKGKATPSVKKPAIEPQLPYSLAILLFDSGVGPSDAPRVALAALSYRTHVAAAAARFKSTRAYLHSWHSNRPSHAALLDALFAPADSEHAPQSEATAVGSELATLLSLRRAFRLYQTRNSSVAASETGLVLCAQLNLLWRARVALPQVQPTLPSSWRGRAWQPGRCECAQPPHSSSWWGLGFPIILSPNLIRGLVSSQQLEASLRGGTTPSSRADAVLRCLLDELQADIE